MEFDIFLFLHRYSVPQNKKEFYDSVRTLSNSLGANDCVWTMVLISTSTVNNSEYEYLNESKEFEEFTSKVLCEISLQSNIRNKKSGVMVFQLDKHRFAVIINDKHNPSIDFIIDKLRNASKKGFMISFGLANLNINDNNGNLWLKQAQVALDYAEEDPIDKVVWNTIRRYDHVCISLH